MKAIHCSVGLISLVCAAAFGQPQQEGQSVSTDELPEAQSQNGISYLCGGVGSSSAASMKQAAQQHELMLTFATREGNYLADVNVDIADAHGRSLLNTTCDGPIMLVDMPKGGRYRVRAAVGGRQASGTVQLRPRDKGKRLELVVPGVPVGQG